MAVAVVVAVKGAGGGDGNNDDGWSVVWRIAATACTCEQNW